MPTTPGNIENLLTNADREMAVNPPVFPVSIMNVLKYVVEKFDMTGEVPNGSVRMGIEDRFSLAYGVSGKIIEYLVEKNIIRLIPGFDHDALEQTEHFTLSDAAKKWLN